MSKYLFGDLVREVKEKVDRQNNPYEFFIAGDHMDTDELHLLRRGAFAGSDVGPAFIRIFKPGQVLYGSRRTYLRKVAVADFEGVTANTTFVLETKDESILHQRLLPFIMQSERFVQHSIKRSKGSTNPYVLFSDLCDYEVDLPDIETQKRLAEILWAIDEVKMAYKRLIAATDELVKSQFIEITQSGDRTPTRMGDIATYVNGYAFKPQDWSFEGVPIIRIQNLNDPSADFNRFTGEIDEKYLVHNGDVLVSWATHLEAYLWNGGDAWLNQHIFKVVFDKRKVNKVFFIFAANYALKEAFKKAHGFKATMEHIKRGDFEDAIVMMPDLFQQEEFATLVRQSDKSKFELEQALSELTATYKRIISEQLG